MIVLVEVEITGDEKAAAEIERVNAALSGPRLYELWERATEVVAGACRDKAPLFMGYLIASIQEEVDSPTEGDIVGLIYSDEFYAPFQERGTAPYWPNFEALEEWAEAHETTSWVVAQAIVDRGLKPLKFFEEGLESTVDQVFDLIGEGVGTIIEGGY